MSIETQSAPIHQAGTNDGWHGVIESGGEFEPEAGRYHLYIGLFCPFAHRANLVRHIKGLQSAIDVSIVRPYPKGDSKGWPGWKFPANEQEYEGATVDKLFGSEYLHEVYFKDDKDYKGRYSVPLLWDKKTNKIVNNESAEILRWLPTAYNGTSIISAEAAEIDLYPESHRKEIDSLSEWIQRDLNSGVYKAGFATTQADYDKAVIPVFGALNVLEKLIYDKGGPYVLGEHLTELDIRLYATLVRFDTVYVQHFKCNLGTIRHDYPVLNAWLSHLYWKVPGFKETTDFKHIKENYTKSHDDINPRAITPRGPFPDVENYIPEKPTNYGGVSLPEVLEYEKKLESEVFGKQKL
ncbi:uncharacterized protein BHQ10_001980 [Talaromyces amestolkiae]|uniref:GST C-terminal domain-containing protein n=1 Tax=Talaromyces amestolkiae TaxID=1196081 RepID=A0A364KQY9_TALAM|nr:uncharacterized protein BHQ10_001980 [Talaromyces amestolkiae]RAO65968.1 hypothetical protein BHQ10_001980 [Talaromyces amestolkiae]